MELDEMDEIVGRPLLLDCAWVELTCPRSGW